MPILKDFLGLDNVSPEAPSGLSAAFNVDITDSKTIKSTPGRRMVHQGTCHSAFSSGDNVYFCEGQYIKALNTSTRVVSTLYSSLVSNARMGWLEVNGTVYASNGTENLVIENGAVRTWGIVPPSAPSVASDYGELPAGKYLVALTFISSTGRESGASTPAVVDCTGGGVSITAIPTSSDATVSYVAVYMSPRNSKTLYFVGAVSNGTVSVLYRGPIPGSGHALQTEGLTNPPGGDLLDVFRGSIYMFNSGTLWRTEPGKFEHVLATRGFLQFPDCGTMVLALEGGVWISTTKEALFLADQVVRSRVSSPAIKGTAMVIDANVIGLHGIQGRVAVWASAEGFIAGLGDGTIHNLTGKRFRPPPSVSGSCAFMNDPTTKKLVVSLSVPANAISATIPPATITIS